MQKLTISNIDWDYPEKENGAPCTLPSQVIIDDESLLKRLLINIDGCAEEVAEYLTETYGHCVCGFTTNVEEVPA